MLDTLGYARVRGYEPPPFLTPAAVARGAARLERVFVLDALGDGSGGSGAAALRARDAQSGRAADPGGAAHVSGVMLETYASLGCATQRLPARPHGHHGPSLGSARARFPCGSYGRIWQL